MCSSTVNVNADCKVGWRRRPACELEINSPLNEYIIVIPIESACVCRVCATAFAICLLAPRRSCENDLYNEDYTIYIYAYIYENAI